MIQEKRCSSAVEVRCVPTFLCPETRTPVALRSERNGILRCVRTGEEGKRGEERERSCYYSTARFAFISPHTFALCSPGSTFSLPLLLPLVFPRFQRAQEHTCARTTPRRSQIRAARADGGDQNTVGVGIPSNQSPQRKWDGKSDTDCL